MTSTELIRIVERAMREPVPDWAESPAWVIVDALQSAGVVAQTEHGPCPKNWGLCACNQDWAPVVTTREGTESYPRSDRGHVFDGCCCYKDCLRFDVQGVENYCEVHDG